MCTLDYKKYKFLFKNFNFYILLVSYYTRNVLITANLSYKMLNILEKDKINVIL